jgi:hypothetical protein
LQLCRAVVLMREILSCEILEAKIEVSQTINLHDSLKSLTLAVEAQLGRSFAILHRFHSQYGHLYIEHLLQMSIALLKEIEDYLLRHCFGLPCLLVELLNQ